jgi:hypothetical protein
LFKGVGHVARRTALAKQVPVTGHLKQRAARQRSPATFYNEDLGTPGMQAAAQLVPGYEIEIKEAPKLKVTADEVFRLAQLQPTQEEAAGYFLMSFPNFQRYLAKPEIRDAWEQGLSRGKVSLRQLMMRHAHGHGPAAVAAAIHLSKFQLGMSEKLLNGFADSAGGPGEGTGALERLAGRIARLVEQRATAAIDVTPLDPGSGGVGVELGLLGAPEAGRADSGDAASSGQVELARVDDPSRARFWEEPDGSGDSAPPGGVGEIAQDLAGGSDGIGHPGRDDRGPVGPDEHITPVEPAEVRADEAPPDLAERRNRDDIFR